MENTILSGGQYGGFIIEGGNAVFRDEANEVVSSVSVTIEGDIITVDGWQYDTSRSSVSNQAEFIGMVE